MILLSNCIYVRFQNLDLDVDLLDLIMYSCVEKQEFSGNQNSSFKYVNLIIKTNLSEFQIL